MNGREPSLAELSEELERRAGADGTVPAGIGRQLMVEKGWRGRLLEVLTVLGATTRTMGYLAGGRRPEEVASALVLWAGSPLSLEEIRLVVESGGWDPEPFAILARAGLLETVLRQPDGSLRRIRGELAGCWVSDQLALADDDEIVAEVRRLLGAVVAATPAARASAMPETC